MNEISEKTKAEQVKEGGLVLQTNATFVNELLAAGRITEAEAEKLLVVTEVAH